MCVYVFKHYGTLARHEQKTHICFFLSFTLFILMYMIRNISSVANTMGVENNCNKIGTWSVRMKWNELISIEMKVNKTNAERNAENWVWR